MAVTTTGKMNTRISFWNKETVINEETGGKTTKLVDKGSFWCAVKTQFLSELQARVGTKYEDTVTFILRESEKSKAIQMAWVLKYQDKDYEIVDINPDPERKDFLIIIGKRK